jgi:hypothetical protein
MILLLFMERNDLVLDSAECLFSNILCLFLISLEECHTTTAPIVSCKNQWSLSLLKSQQSDREGEERLTLSTISLSAPFSKRSVTVGPFPWIHAKWRGVWPD